MIRHCIAVCITAFLLLLSCTVRDSGSGAGLYLIRYGKSMFPEHYIFHSADQNNVCPFSWCFYLLKTENRVVLIDTGFTDRKYVRSFRLTSYHNPAALLKKTGVNPEDVQDIILTHSHFDHIGAVHLFPNARVHIQRKEFTAYRRTSRFSRQKSYFSERKTKGMLHLHDGDFRFSEMVTVKFSGGHTSGSQAVYISCGGRRYAVVGDECYFRRCCTGAIPLPGCSCENTKRNISFLRKISTARKNEHIVVLPMHDPVIAKEYSEITPGVFRIFQL